MSTGHNANRDLADYLHRRLEYMEHCNAQIESKLSNDERDLLRKIDNGQYTRRDPAIGKVIFHIEYVVRNTFRYTMLVGICSFLEEAMKEITKRLCADYDERLKRKRSGNWLRKHMKVLSDSVGLAPASLCSDLDRFDDLITLRNCVVHAWGKVTEARDAQGVQDAATRLETVEISRDGYLVLGDQVVPEAITTAENIAESILTSKLNVSMT